MEIPVSIKSKDRKLAVDLFEDYRFLSGETEKEIVEGISIRYESEEVIKSFDVPKTLEIMLIIGKEIVLPVAVALLSRYLYDKLKGKTDKITINYIDVNIDAKEIEQTVLSIIENEIVNLTPCTSEECRQFRLAYHHRLSDSGIGLQHQKHVCDKKCCEEWFVKYRKEIEDKAKMPEGFNFWHDSE